MQLSSDLYFTVGRPKFYSFKNLSYSNLRAKLKSFIHLIANSKTLPNMFKTSDTNTVRLLTRVLSDHSYLNSFKYKIDRKSHHYAHVVLWVSKIFIEPETYFHFLCMYLLFRLLETTSLFYANPYLVTHKRAFMTSTNSLYSK